MTGQICCDKFKNAIINRVVLVIYSRWVIQKDAFFGVSITNCPWCGAVLEPPVTIETEGHRKPKLTLVKNNE